MPSNRNDYEGLDEGLTLRRIVQSLLAQVETATLVRIEAVYPPGELMPWGLVDVRPLVQQVGSDGQTVEQPVIYAIPFLRLQGGTNAIEIDPQIGDVGICVFCSRDCSAVLDTGQSAPPATPRRFDLSDGLYLGGLLNAQPQRVIRFTDGGIEIEAMGTVRIVGDVVVDGDVIANGVSLTSHTHTGVQSGPDTSGGPL